MIQLKTMLAVLMLFSTVVFVSCDDEDDDMPSTIVSAAQADSELSTLVDALTRAGLVDAVNSASAKTVFAPTNAAFSQLLTDLGAASLNDVDSVTLRNILLYHVIGSGAIDAANVPTDATYLETLSPSPDANKNVTVLVQRSGNDVTLNGTFASQVTTADITTDNGIIHKINKVLLPPDVTEIAIWNGGFTSLVQALTDANLVSTLADPNSTFTVFAPTDVAFAAADTVIAGLTAQQVSDVLTYHVNNQDNILASELSNGTTVATILGQTFTININGSSVTITDASNNTANIVLTDIQGTNGVVHVVDAVLIPVL